MPEPQDLLVILAIGLIAGWLASLITGGGGLVRDLVTGLLGAIVGSVIIYGFGVALPFHNPLVSDIVMSTIGAVVVIVISRLAFGRRSQV
jgi:uncharacterized membrane protein YeaQ/YmgE (transglycosylase-associated protein family)